MRNKREKLLLTVALVVVSILIGDRLVLGPLVNSWQIRNKEIEKLEENIDKGNKLLPREKSTIKKWHTYLRDNLNSTNSIAQAEVLRARVNWTGDSGISFQSEKGEWRNHDDRYQTYDVRLVAEGTMREVVEFVHAIESDALPLKIEQLELASREKTGQLISVSVHFTGLQLGKALQ